MTCDEMYQIYEHFTDQIINGGWNGTPVSWTETVRSEVGEGTWHLFELDNGVTIEFVEPAEGSDGEPFLEYWPEGSDDEQEGIPVESLEQLLQLLN